MKIGTLVYFRRRSRAARSAMRGIERGTPRSQSERGAPAADAKWTIVGNAPVSKTYNSKKEFMDEVIGPFGARMSKRFVPTAPRGIYADGDMVIAFFDGEGTALDGKPYKNTYTWYMRFKDEEIVEAVAFFDTIEFTDFWNRVKPAKQTSA